MSSPSSAVGDRFTLAPVSSWLGLQVEPAAADGRTVVAVEAGPQHANPMGRVHGGVLAALADAAMGTVYGRELEEGRGFGTVELKMNFIRPVRLGRITATARVVRRGLRLGFLDCELHDARGRLVATATSTCLTETDG
jgi:uncharacterized protein (TIGR00369 family)